MVKLKDGVRYKEIGIGILVYPEQMSNHEINLTKELQAVKERLSTYAKDIMSLIDNPTEENRTNTKFKYRGDMYRQFITDLNYKSIGK